MNKKVRNTVFQLIALITCVGFFIPIILIIINAAKDSFAITNTPLSWPTHWATLLENIQTVWTSQNIQYRSSFVSSIIITVGSLVFIALFSSMAGWVLVRHKSKLSTAVFLVLVGAMVIPFQSLMLPLVAWFRTLGVMLHIPLLRSYTGMIFAYVGFGVPLSVFLFHGFIKAIPLELEEAARVDGCSRFQVFFYIVMPILRPVYITVLILNGIWIWNDFLLPLLILGKGNDIQTVPLAVSNFVGSFVREWDLILTVSLMSIIPVVIVFLFAQKYIIRGMVEGSIK